MAREIVLCVVVPCYNEEQVLPSFLRAVVPELELATSGRWQIVFVDDGSTDGTFAAIAGAHIKDSRVTCVRLSRNFGHQAAVSAGLAFAKADYIAVIDCDLQDPISILIELYKTAKSDDLDVCYGIRSRRDAPILLKIAYSLYYRIAARMAEHHWPRDAGDFCVMSARCHRVVLCLPEHSRILRGLRSWVGFKQAGFAYERPGRQHGTTKYNFRRLFALGMQGLVAFSNIPLRLASVIGLLMGGAAMLVGLIVLLNRLFPRFTIFGYWVGTNPGTASILCFLSFVFSVLFLCIGILGEYLVVLLQEVKRRPTAVIASVLGEVEKNPHANQVFHDEASQPEQHQKALIP